MKRIFALLPVALMAWGSSLSAGVPTKISYQGQYAVSGVLASGTHVFAWQLYDSQSGGALLWTDTDTLTVEDGVFHAYLGENNPLPPSMFDGQALWIETIVDGVPMPGRHPLVSVAYSFHAQTADTAFVALNSLSGGDTLWQTDGTNVWRSGRVGIGTATPERRLHLASDDEFQTAILIDNDGVDGDPVVRFRLPSIIEWVAGMDDGDGDKFKIANSGVLSTLTRMTIDDGGNVGIGTANPGTKLDVVGVTRAESYSTTSQPLGNGSSAGNLYFDRLVFSGTYAYGVGDESIEFESDFDSSVGGQGTMAKMTAYRSPDGFFAGEGNLKFSLRSGPNLTDVLTLYSAGNASVAGAVTAATYYGDGSNLTGIAGTTDNDWQIGSGVVYNTTDNVGVGTSSPVQNLHALENSSTDNDVAILADQQATTGNVFGVKGTIAADGKSATDGLNSTGSAAGIYGKSTQTGPVGDVFGVLGEINGEGGDGPGPNLAAGVYGVSYATIGKSAGVVGDSQSSDPSGAGVFGVNKSDSGPTRGVWGEVKSPDGYGVYGRNVQNNVLYVAGHFEGHVEVVGNLSKGGGSFRIDHPLDPYNKYLHHSFVESPDMMNVYNGNVILDASGEATVPLPEWFEVLNRDFRYQLTAIGGPGPSLYIAEEIRGNSFRIAGGTPGLKVSWQVTGIRQDTYANAHRIPVEEDKPSSERGKLLYP